MRGISVLTVPRPRVRVPSSETYEDIVEEALAFGWVDSQGRRLDDRRWQLYCAPRKRGSAWSRANAAESNASPPQAS